MQGRLSAPVTLERQVRRMLADPRADALASRFAAQWLRLRDVEEILPDALLYPYFDRTLGQAMMRETELFFNSLVREDRSLLDLITADYTFVNERLAKHYGIPNITGAEFQRVTVPDYRRGILGQGSMLVQTSVADRTSPVMRGKWVLEVLLGSPPPPPPPNVPALDEGSNATSVAVRTVRQRMEEHRKNPACTSCHRVMDPLGLALENFDVTGRWRIKDAGQPIDSNGELYDGTPMAGAAGLRAALLKHKTPAHAEFHREPDDLRPRPTYRIRRYARGAARHSRGRSEGLQAVGIRARRGDEPGISNERVRAGRDRRAGAPAMTGRVFDSRSVTCMC